MVLLLCVLLVAIIFFVANTVTGGDSGQFPETLLQECEEILTAADALLQKKDNELSGVSCEFFLSESGYETPKVLILANSEEFSCRVQAFSNLAKDTTKEQRHYYVQSFIEHSIPDFFFQRHAVFTFGRMDDNVGIVFDLHSGNFLQNDRSFEAQRKAFLSRLRSTHPNLTINLSFGRPESYLNFSGPESFHAHY